MTSHLALPFSRAYLKLQAAIATIIELDEKHGNVIARATRYRRGLGVPASDQEVILDMNKKRKVICE